MNVAGLLIAFLLATAFALALIPLAQRWGWMDHPEERKLHRDPTPLVGGPAIFLALFLTLGWVGLRPAALTEACLVVLVSGIVDDRRPLHAYTRFAAQILACLIMILTAGIALHDFGRLMWDGVLGLGWLWAPITVFSALGVINAFNMIDGLDGLSGTVFVICCASMALLADLAGQGGAVFLLQAGAAAVLGFLFLNARFPWNRRARVFLGDSGSSLLGFFLAWMFIDLGGGPDRAFAPITAVWIFGIPLLDTTRLMVLRWRQGRSAFDADRYHLHHAFLRAGFGVRATWLIIGALSAACAGVGVLSELAGVPEYWRFWAFMAVGLVYFRVMKQAWRRQRFLGRRFGQKGPVDSG